MQRDVKSLQNRKEEKKKTKNKKQKTKNKKHLSRVWKVGPLDKCFLLKDKKKKEDKCYVFFKCKCDFFKSK